MIGMRYLYEVKLVGDAASTLSALATLLTCKEDRSWREGIEHDVRRWWDTMDAEAMVEADPVNPMRNFSEFSAHASEDSMIFAHSGSIHDWYARHIRKQGSWRGTQYGNFSRYEPAVATAIWVDSPPTRRTRRND